MKTEEAKLPIINPHACGIDVGSRTHYVATGQGKDHVKSFGVYSDDHDKMIVYLKEKKVQTIAMESTGNYWQTLYMALEEAGFEVFLVCGNQTRNVKGRKTDVQDCQWIQWLHSVGMLSHSFIPEEFVGHVRIFTRQRNKYVRIQTRIINQLQHNLRSMNIRLEVALRDITGKSGRAIIEAILAGERNPDILASLADWRVRKSKQEIALSLEGNWHPGYLFILKQHYEEYLDNLRHIRECEEQIERLLSEYLLESEIDKESTPHHKKAIKKNKQNPYFDLQQYSFQYFNGVDLFAIEGINQNTVLTLISEVGRGIDMFSGAKAFVNWLHLCPNPKISGGKVLSNRIQKGTNPLTQSLKSAANAIGNMKMSTHLTRFFRRIAFRKGRKEAIAATANKLAVIIYNMLTKYQQYQPYDNRCDDERKRKKELTKIERLIQRHGIRMEEVNFTC